MVKYVAELLYWIASHCIVNLNNLFIFQIIYQAKIADSTLRTAFLNFVLL